MNHIEALRANWRAQMREIDAPEFANGAGRFSIYYTPYSAAELAALGPLYQADGLDAKVEALWQTLRLKALDDQGGALFKAQDREAVLGALSPTRLDEIAGQMLEHMNAEEAEKN